MNSLLRFPYWVGGPIRGPALIVERCLFRRTRRRPELQHPQATRLWIILNMLSRFNKAWRLTSVRYFIVSPSQKVCRRSGLNMEVDWRKKVSIILYQNINISCNTTWIFTFVCLTLAPSGNGGNTYKGSPSVSDPKAINFLNKFITSSY